MDDHRQAPVEEDSVDFVGRYFTMKDCQSKPKPLSKPRPELICAGMSDRGFQFSVRRGRRLLHRRRSRAEHRDASRRAKALGSELGKTVRTYAMCTIIHAESDAERRPWPVAMPRARTWARSWPCWPAGACRPTSCDRWPRSKGAFMTETIVGSPESCREQVEAFMTDCELDGLMLIFPDYVEGLAMFGSEILPKLRSRVRVNLEHWIAPGRTALLIVDMQVDFASPED
jgi:pyrimidine oxygenase